MTLLLLAQFAAMFVIRESVLHRIIREGVLEEARRDIAYAEDPEDGQAWAKMRGYRIAKALVDIVETAAKGEMT